MRKRFSWTIILLLVFYSPHIYGGAGSTSSPIDTALTNPIDRLNDHAWSMAFKNPDSALIYAQQASEASIEASNYPRGLINANTLMGILNKDRGYYQIAVEHYITAMQIAESEGDSLRVSGCLNNLGVVAQKQENYPKALEYYMRSLDIENKVGTDKAQVSIRLYNIGESYELMDSLDEAYAYFYNSLLIEEDLDNDEGIFYARLGIGKVDSRNGNQEKAMGEFNRALELAIKLENHVGTCETYIARAKLNFIRKDYAQAQSDFQTALGIARKYQFKGIQVQVLNGLYKIHRAQADFKASLERLEEQNVLREELNSVKVNNRIGELQTRYEVKKKEQEIEELHRIDDERQNEIISMQKVITYLSIVLAFVVFISVFNIWKKRNSLSK